jgi:hypothetical protein
MNLSYFMVNQQRVGRCHTKMEHRNCYNEPKFLNLGVKKIRTQTFFSAELPFNLNFKILYTSASNDTSKFVLNPERCV